MYPLGWETARWEMGPKARAGGLEEEHAGGSEEGRKRHSHTASAGLPRRARLGSGKETSGPANTAPCPLCVLRCLLSKPPCSPLALGICREPRGSSWQV